MRVSGKKVREGREQLALSVDDASEGAGVSPHTWLRAEHGGELRPTSVRRIASYLGASPAELMDKPPPKVQTLSQHNSWEEAQADVLTRQRGIEAKVEEWGHLDDPLSEVDRQEVEAVLDSVKDLEHILWLALPGSQSVTPTKVAFDPEQVAAHQWEAIDAARNFSQHIAEELEDMGLVRIVEREGGRTEPVLVEAGA